MKYDIGTFVDLMEEISYSWDVNYKLHEMEVDGKPTGVFNLNKLYIYPDKVVYKEHIYSLEPKVYNKFLEFFKLLEKNEEN